MDTLTIHEVLSGRRRTVGAAALRFGLSILEPCYTVGATFQRFLYNMHLKPRVRVARPVISIGNITTGGTGKTPVTAVVVAALEQLGHRPGIASRGYRALIDPQTGEPIENDEKRLLAAMCPGVPHRQDRDRVRMARELIAQDACDCVVLDDGFQHRRLERDLDLVLIDAVCPFGYGHLLPRGLLREPLTSLQRADLILLTRCDSVAEAERDEIRETLSLFTAAPVLEMTFQPAAWLDLDGEKFPLEQTPEQPLAFCGIGNPYGFRRQLEQLGIGLADESFHVFPDHHHYRAEEISALVTRAAGRPLLTTHKDLVKLQGLIPSEVSCRALLISGCFCGDGLETLTRHLQGLFPQTELA